MTSILEKGKTSNNSLRPENGIDSEFKDIELNKYIQNKFCLIDRNWIKIWKRYTGYKEIFNLYNGNFIQDKDLSNIKSIIEKNIREKNLVNLDMTKIYKNNSLDINSNFDIFLVKFIHFCGKISCTLARKRHIRPAYIYSLFICLRHTVTKYADPITFHILLLYISSLKQL